MTDAGMLERIIELHGHMCPGLAMGVRAAELETSSTATTAKRLHVHPPLRWEGRPGQPAIGSVGRE